VENIKEDKYGKHNKKAGRGPSSEVSAK